MNRNKRPIVKWLQGICLGLLIVLAILLAAAPVVVNSHGAQQWLARRINAAINGQLSWQTLHVSLFSGKVSAGQVLLTDEAGRKIVYIAHLETTISWPRLFRGVLYLDPVILEKPRVSLEIGADGEVNLARALGPSHPAPETPPKSSPGLAVILRVVKLSQGRVNFSLPQDGIRMTALGVEISGTADFSAPTAAVALSAVQLRYRGPALAEDLSGLQLRAALDGQRLRLQTLRLSSAFSKLKIGGSIDDLFGRPRFDLSGQLKTRLAEVGRIFGIKPRPTGAVTLSMAVEGPLDNPRAILQIRYGGGKLFRRDVAGAALRLNFENLKLAFDGSATDTAAGKIKLAGAVDLSRAFAGHRLSAALDVQRVAYRCDLRTSNLDLAGLLPQLPGLTGRLTARVQGAGEGLLIRDMDGRLSFQGRLEQLKDRRLAVPVNMRLSGRASAREGSLTLSALSLRAGGTVLDGRAGFDLRRRTGTASIRVASRDLARDLSPLGIEGISGSLNGRVNAAGSLAKPQFAIFLQSRGLSAGKVKVGNLKVAARVGPEGVLRVSALTLENGASRIRASGRLPLYDILAGQEMHSDLRLSAALDHVDPRDFVADLPLAGIFSGRLSACGRLPELFVRATLAGRGLKIDGLQVGRLDAGLRLKNGELFLDRLRVHRRKSEILARGRMRLFRQNRLVPAKDPAFELHVAAPRLHLEDFTSRLGGQVNLDADFRGTLHRPSGTVRVDAQNLETGVQKIARIAMLARVAGDVLQIENLSLWPVPGHPIKGHGQISRNGDYAVELAADALPLKAIGWLRQRQKVQGNLALRLSGRGSLKSPRLWADVRISSLRIDGKPFEDALLQATLHNSSLHLEGRLNFDVKADCDLQNREFRVSAAFNRTEVGRYLDLAGLSGWSGRLTGRLSGEGRLGALEAMAAVLELSDVNFSYAGREILAGRRLSLDYRRGRIAFRNLELKLLETGRLTIRGQAAPNGLLKVRIAGNLPMAELQVFSDAFGNPQGQLKLDVRVGGALKAPDVQGTVDLDNISIIVPGLNQRLHDLNGQIVFTPQRIDFNKISAMLDNGRLLLTGKVDLQGLKPAAVALKLKARELAMEPVQDVEAVLDADLSLTGSAAKSLLAGKIELAEGYYERDVNLSLLKIAGKELALLGKKRRAFTAPAVTFRSRGIPFAKNMRLDVGLSTRQPLVVDNDLAEMQVSADLNLGGSVARPSLSGRATVDSGTVTFQGQAFEITRGIIDFVNPYRIEPNLDIRSEGQVGNYRIFLALQGPVSELELKLSSDPPLPDADILSLILFGRTTAELGKGSGVSGQEIAAELISSGLGNKVKKKIGLDTLRAEAQPTSEGSGNSTAPVRITVGKNLNQRLSVKYQFTTGGNENIQRTVADYKLLEDLIVSVYQESTGTFGGMFKYRLEFR